MNSKPYLLNALLHAKKDKNMVSVYFAEDDTEACATGYVLDATHDGLTLKHFTQDGAPDGEVLIRMDHIFMVDVAGRYEKKIAFLANNYEQVF